MNIQNEEKISSTLVITFIGFTDYLVLEFLDAVIHDFNDSKNIDFLFIQSKDAGDKKDVVFKIKNNSIAKIRSNWPNKDVQEEYVGNIYDFTNYLNLLKKYSNAQNLILNVSAGPYTYTSAASIFGLMHGSIIYYNVLTATKTTFFRPINTKPLKYIFNLIPIDREIINILKNNKSCSVNDLYILMNQNGIKSTTRNIQYRLNELYLEGIVFKSGKKSALYYLNEFIKTLL